MGILLTEEENVQVYVDWTKAWVKHQPLDFNELDNMRNRAQLKKVVEWLLRHPAFCAGEEIIAELKKEADLWYHLR